MPGRCKKNLFLPQKQPFGYVQISVSAGIAPAVCGHTAQKVLQARFLRLSETAATQQSGTNRPDGQESIQENSRVILQDVFSLYFV